MSDFRKIIQTIRLSKGVTGMITWVYHIGRSVRWASWAQAGKDVKENLKNWAKQQEAELAEDGHGDNYAPRKIVINMDQLLLDDWYPLWINYNFRLFQIIKRKNKTFM